VRRGRQFPLALVVPIAEERLRLLPGMGGPLAPATIVGMSIDGQPLVKIETPLQHVDEAASIVRAYLARRDQERRR
jgi:hypothetical protein